MSEIEILNDKYRLDRLIGQGGFGEVYQATDLTLQRQVAVKLIKDSIVGQSDMSVRFLNEARLTSQLKHPHTLTIYDFGKHNKQLFLVSELLEGEDLRARLRKVKHLQPHEMITLFIPICKALHEAHLAGIIHRDLKPDNLFLNRSFDEDKMILLDFGIAKTLNQAHHTQTGSFVGTPHYMAPEQIRTSKSITHVADIYSLGIIFYEALSGSEPYQGGSIFEVLEQHIKAEIPKIDIKVSSELQPFESLISSMLSKNPRGRPQSTLEIAEELERIKTQIPAIIDLSEHLSKQVSVEPIDMTIGQSQLYSNSSLDITLTPSLLKSQSELGVTLDEPQYMSGSSLKVNTTTSQSIEHQELDRTLDTSQLRSSPLPNGEAFHHQDTKQILSHNLEPKLNKNNEVYPSETALDSAPIIQEINLSDVNEFNRSISKEAVSQYEIQTNQIVPPLTTSPKSKLLLNTLIFIGIGLIYFIWTQVVDQNHLRSNLPVTESSEAKLISPKLGSPQKTQKQKSDSKTQVKSVLTTKKSTLKDMSVSPSTPAPNKVKTKAKVKKRKVRKPARKNKLKGLSIKLTPRYATYKPKSTVKLYAKVKVGASSSRQLRVRFTPSHLGSFSRVKNTIDQKEKLVGKIKWKSEGKGVIKVCLGKQCHSEKIVVRNLDLGKSLDITTDGINMDQLDEL